jgi:hypothetical protein
MTKPSLKEKKPDKTPIQKDKERLYRKIRNARYRK